MAIESGNTANRNFLFFQHFSTALKFFRILWPLPVTLIGLTLAVFIRGTNGCMQKHGIALEAFGGTASTILWLMNPWATIQAITLGHIIIARDAATAEQLRAHEQVHVRQYERWGFIFPIAYLAASVIAALKGGDAYRNNVFEVEASAIKTNNVHSIR